MRRATVACWTLALSLGAGADCVTNPRQETVCGAGQCEMDQYGKVFCAAAGGGAIRDSYGNVACGVGRCEKDIMNRVWCSKEPGGGAARDSAGNVKCLGGCEEASPKACREGK